MLRRRTKAFYATESTFLAVLLSYNLLSQVTRQSGYRKPSTMRAAVFVGGAILGRKGCLAHGGCAI